jgi:hypothetical protein
MVQNTAKRWPGRMPLWLYGAIMFPVCVGVWTAVDVWATRGTRPGDPRLFHGTTEVLIVAAFNALFWTGLEWWRRRQARKT